MEQNKIYKIINFKYFVYCVIVFFSLFLFYIRNNVNASDINSKKDKELKEVIKQNNLGELQNISPNNIIVKIKISNPKLLNKDVQIVKIEDNSVVIKSNNYKNTATVYFTFDKNKFNGKPELRDVLKNTLLGEIENNSPNTIIKKIKELNKNLINKDIQVVSILTKGALIESNDYNNALIVNFNVKKDKSNTRQDLRDILTKSNLGEITNNSESAIIEKIKNLNPIFIKKDIQVVSILKNGALVKSNDYDDATLVYYSLKKNKPQEEKELKDVLTQTLLGEIENNSPNTIIEKTKSLNKNLKHQDLKTIKINDDNALIKSNDYKNTTIVYFTLQKDIKEALAQTHLGKIENNLPNTIIEKIKDFNKNLFNKDLQTIKIYDDNAVIKSVDYKNTIKVDFTLKQELKEVLKQTHLGEIENNLQNTIIEKIKSLNKHLTKNDLQIIKINEDSASIKSNDYKNIITVYFTLKKDIKEVLTQTNLGSLDNNSSNTIIEQIKKINKNLKHQDVQTIKIYDNNALIKSDDYKNTITVYFTLKTDIKDILTQINLGEIDNNSPNTIIENIKILNTKLLNKDIQTIKIYDNNALIKSEEYKNIITVYFTLKKELKEVLTKTHLGEIENNLSITIIEKIKDLNKNLINKDIQTTKIYDDNALIKSEDYPYTAKVDFTLKKELKEVLTKTHLGEIENNLSITIIDKIKALNSKLTYKDVQIIQIYEDNALIKSNDYKNTITVDFTLKKELKEVLTQTNLGEIENNSSNVIIEKIKDLNKNLIHKKLQISKIYEDNALIKSDDYKNTTIVYFIVKQDIKEVLKQTHLGEIENNSPNTIIEKIKTLNPNLINKELQTTKIYDDHALIKSDDYKNTITVDFNLKKDKNPEKQELKNFLTQTFLGEIENNLSSTIIEKIKNLNKNLINKNLQTIQIYEDNALIKSDDYKNTITVDFTLKKELNEVLTKTNLGEIENNLSNIIIEKIKDLNQNLINKNLQTIKIYDNNALIKSNDYPNTVKVDFTLKQDIKEVLKQTRLGEIDDNLPNTIIEKIQDLNQNLINKNLQTIKIYEDNALIKSEDYKNTIAVQFTLKKDIKEVLTKTHLGEIENNSSITIIDKIKNLNKNLINKNLQIITTNDNNALIESTDYKNTITVDFTLKKDKQLKDVLKQTNLGEMENNLSATIIEKIKVLNKILINKDLQTIKIYDDSALIQSDDYKNIITVDFTLKKDKSSEIQELKDVLKQTNLGEIENNSSITIIEKIKSLNKILINKDLQTIKIYDNSALIKSEDYKNTITIDFTLIKDKQLKEVLTQANLGEIENNSSITIIDKIKSLNKNLINKNLQTIKIYDDSALIQSEDYKNIITVDFTLKKDKHHEIQELKNVLTKTNLGEIENNSEKEIISQIKKLNPNLNIENIKIEIITNKNKAKIESEKYKGEQEIYYTLKKDIKQTEQNHILKIFIAIIFVLTFIIFYFIKKINIKTT
ncbi:hypothetical protein ['Camptotheca acuminata' phytoplasma]|uniref:hypothetical protein n=1 Tax='Camptotheca acuminata' phytoplasma TaxID=3239192 RepID=UPI00351A76F7